MLSRFLISLLVVLLIAGCEDVVDVDIEDASPRLVIEGRIYNGHASFYISRSIGLYSDEDVQPVGGATVVITDENGLSDTLVELYLSAGTFYSNRRYGTDTGVTYHAAVTVGGQTYTASTTMPPYIPIDSLGTEFTEGIGAHDELVDGYQIHVHFQDAADRADYARIKLHRDGAVYTEYALYDDRFTDGNAVDYEYEFYVFQPGNEIDVEFVSMDRVMYEYFQTLAEVWISEDGGSILDASPANPNTNWSGDALGYFGAFVSSYSSIRVQGE